MRLLSSISTSNTKKTNRCARFKSSTVALFALLCVLAWSVLFVVYNQNHSGTSAGLEEYKAQLLTDAHGQKLQAKLESAQRRIQELERLLQQKEKEKQEEKCLPPVQAQAQPQPETQRQSQAPFVSQNPVCQGLPQPIPTAAAAFWQY